MEQVKDNLTILWVFIILIIFIMILLWKFLNIWETNREVWEEEFRQGNMENLLLLNWGYKISTWILKIQLKYVTLKELILKIILLINELKNLIKILNLLLKYLIRIRKTGVINEINEMLKISLEENKIIILMKLISKKLDGYPKRWELIKQWRLNILKKYWIGFLIIPLIKWIGRILRYKLSGDREEIWEGIIWINEIISIILLLFLLINLIDILIGIKILTKNQLTKIEEMEWEKILGFWISLCLTIFGINIITGGMWITGGVEIMELNIGFKIKMWIGICILLKVIYKGKYLN